MVNLTFAIQLMNRNFLKQQVPDIIDPKPPIIEVVSEDFNIPQLNKKRKIYALLPPDYYHSEKEYPVLYLQDAQNLFDEHNPYGNWEIDKHLAQLYAEKNDGLIVIAIDHGGKERINEYSPYYHRRFGNGGCGHDHEPRSAGHGGPGGGRLPAPAHKGQPPR